VTDEPALSRKIPVICLGHRTVRSDLTKVMAAPKAFEIEPIEQK
jgi:hypothetical protein